MYTHTFIHFINICRADVPFHVGRFTQVAAIKKDARHFFVNQLDARSLSPERANKQAHAHTQITIQI